MFPTVSDVKQTLGDAYTSISDDVISNFLDKRIAEVKELTGEEFSDFVPEAIRKWVLYNVCADIILRDLTGKDTADALQYSIGELRESKDPNVQLKLKLYEIYRTEAQEALKSYFSRTRTIFCASSEA